MRIPTTRLGAALALGAAAVLAPALVQAQTNMPPPPPTFDGGPVLPPPTPIPPPTPAPPPTPTPPPTNPPSPTPPPGGGSSGGQQGGGQSGAGGTGNAGGANNGGGNTGGPAGPEAPAPQGDQTTPPQTPDTSTAPQTHAPQIDPAVEKIIRASIAAYKKLTSYSDSVAVTASDASVYSGTDKVKKPGLVSCTAKVGNVTFRAVADGTNIFGFSSDQPQRYLKQPAGSDAIPKTMGVMPTHGTGIVAILLAKSDPYDLLTHGVTSSSVLDSATADTVSVDVIKLVQPGATLVMSIGKTDHLLRKLVVTTHGATITESRTNVQANPDLPAKTFTFTPPAGAKLVTPPGAAPPPTANQPGSVTM